VYHPIEYYRRTGTSKIRPRHFLDFMILVLRMAMLFQPLKIFVPLAVGAGIIGVGKVALDVVGLFARTTVRGWSLLFQPTLSTSAILLLLLGFQLLLVGMVADGVLRRIAQRNRLSAPSHAVWVREPRRCGPGERAATMSGSRSSARRVAARMLLGLLVHKGLWESSSCRDPLQASAARGPPSVRLVKLGKMGCWPS
jgi:hypothetical protein